MKQSFQDTTVYHIYPLGQLGAPQRNDFSSEPTPRLAELHDWLPHLNELGVNALYLGPLFESSAHGYDTADYYHVDRRLGTNETLQTFSKDLRGHGIRLVLDAVFNHVGRDFWAFKDVLKHGETSSYKDWFHLDFGVTSPQGDPFGYEGWSGNYDLVKLNLKHPDVRAHLFDAVAAWVRDFEISGLRLDAADVMDFDFLHELAQFCRKLEPDFWLMGEVVHGDYSKWVNPDMLDSATNYELYKGLWSSHADKNYFELAHSLKRQFGEGGVYEGLNLYTFADNHDVNRVASSLEEPAHLYPLYTLLFTVPGVPSIYAGSEWGLSGKRTNTSDEALRPRLELPGAKAHAPHPDLADLIAKLTRLRRDSSALQRGNYQELLVDHEQLAFLRESAEEKVVVMTNASEEEVTLDLKLPASHAHDLLNSDEHFDMREGQLSIPVSPRWARVLRLS